MDTIFYIRFLILTSQFKAQR